MSNLQNLNPLSLYLPSNNIITTPYEKVLNIINEAKRFINMMSKNQSKLIRELEWVIKIITSHSLYKYELKDLDKIEKYTKDNPDFKQFVDFVYEYNEEVIEMNKKKDIINSQSLKMSNELLQIPSFKLKRKNIQKNVNNISKRNKNLSHQKMNSFSSTFKNQNNLSLNSLKQLLKFNQNPLPNYIPLKNQNKNNNSLKSSLELKNSKNNRITSLFRSFNLNNQNENKNSNNQSLKNSRANSYENKIENSFSYIEHVLTGANYDPKQILEKDFNIFELKKIIGHGNVLPLMGKTILESFGLLDNNIIETKKLDNFLYSITKQYHTTTLYHNSIHGADVTQTISLFFLNSNAEEICSTNVLDLLSILISALGHDIGHPGFTNNFQINASTDMALTYNDISCLENFHVSKLFKTIKKDENNIFIKLNVDDYKTIRKRMISEILATDMANHGKVMGVVKAKVENFNKENNNDNDNNNEKKKFEFLTKNPKTQFEEQQSLLDFFIHAADLAHNTKLFKISLQWVELLTNEFWLQGDKEKELNLPVSFLCDRVGSDIPSSQVGFISGFILPTFDVLISMFPTLNYTVENAKNNITEWKKLVEQHRLTGWTPREKKEEKENGISKNQINHSLNGGNSLNGSNDNNNNNLSLKGKIINNRNNINNINPFHSEEIKNAYTANWGKPKLITIKKQHGK